jgi:hypothetical protein
LASSARTRDQDGERHQVCGHADEKAKPDAPSVPHGVWVMKLSRNRTESSADNGRSDVWIRDPGHARVKETKGAAPVHEVGTFRQEDAMELDNGVEVEGCNQNPDSYQYDGE